MSEYTEQADKFLTETETTFKSLYKDHNFYFPDDKDRRDIYSITLKNKSGKYSFTFGQSTANTGTHPTSYSVLASITKSDPGTFENFCSEFGYEQDSRNAEKTYKAVCKEWKGVSKIFTPEQLEKLQEIN